jgi:hypothetical protein
MKKELTPEEIEARAQKKKQAQKEANARWYAKHGKAYYQRKKLEKVKDPGEEVVKV